jgi:hypothetical protein
MDGGAKEHRDEEARDTGEEYLGSIYASIKEVVDCCPCT